MQNLIQLIENTWENRDLLKEKLNIEAIHKVIEMLDKGQLRTAEPTNEGWQVNEWVKKAVILYFPTMPMKIMQEGPEQYYDKIPLKMDMVEQGIRTVPGSILRYGAHVAKGVICMPSFINIGAYVDSGTMIDTWATVGSCAQIGKNVHLSGGVGIGGVLEPVQAAPVIIEDDCFIGSRCIIVEGVKIGTQSVIGAGVTITQSTHIIDVSGSEPITYKGVVPPRSVVIPGSYPKKFNSGEYHVNCALIIGKRKESTDLKTSLNDTLREFNLSV